MVAARVQTQGGAARADNYDLDTLDGSVAPSMEYHTQYSLLTTQMLAVLTLLILPGRLHSQRDSGAHACAAPDQLRGRPASSLQVSVVYTCVRFYAYTLHGEPQYSLNVYL